MYSFFTMGERLLYLKDCLSCLLRIANFRESFENLLGRLAPFAPKLTFSRECFSIDFVERYNG